MHHCNCYNYSKLLYSLSSLNLNHVNHLIRISVSLLEMRSITMVSPANFITMFVEWMAEKLWVKRVKRPGLSTQPCGIPVYRISGADADFPILTTWGLLVRKSLFQEQSDAEQPGLWNFRVSGRTVLKAELTSRNSILTYVSGINK